MMMRRNDRGANQRSMRKKSRREGRWCDGNKKEETPEMRRRTLCEL
jgi:hypothetical protein